MPQAAATASGGNDRRDKQRVVVLDESDYKHLLQSALATDSHSRESSSSGSPSAAGTPPSLHRQPSSSPTLGEPEREPDEQPLAVVAATSEEPLGCQNATEAEPHDKTATAAETTESDRLERALCRVPRSRRWEALCLLEQLRDLPGFTADPISLRIFLESHPLPEPDQDFTLADLLHQTCSLRARVCLPAALGEFFRAKGLCKFPNAKADLSRSAWVTRFAFPASTMATRWAPFVARRRSTDKRGRKASK